MSKKKEFTLLMTAYLRCGQYVKVKAATEEEAIAAARKGIYRVTDQWSGDWEDADLDNADKVEVEVYKTEENQ